MKQFLIKHKKTILSFVMLIGIAIILGLIFLGILWATNVIQYNNGFILNKELFNGLRNSIWLYIVFLILQIIITTFLSFIPGTSMLFIALGVVLFGSTWQCFLVCFSGVILSSVCMDLLGRFGGSKLVNKMIGQEEYNSALNLVRNHGKVYVPIMYLLPIFPDDAICMCCGTLKMNFWFHLSSIMLCRGIGCATIIFGINLIPYNDFTNFYDWFVFGAVLIVYIVLLFRLAKFIDKKMNEKKEK